MSEEPRRQRDGERGEMRTAIDMEKWRADRKQALLQGTVSGLIDYLKRWDREAGLRLSIAPRQVQEGAMHKAITGATDLPLEYRRKSKAWLDERGLQSFDDGDL